MKEVQLTQGYVALVDDEDLDRVNQFKWCARIIRRDDKSVRLIYAHRAVRTKTNVWTVQLMHCFILGIKGIDHRDGNGLNNQRYNLRPATKSQNKCNTKLRTDNTSGFKGVYWDTNKWQASIRVRGKSIRLGRFTDILDARDAADARRLKYHGEFALTNAMLVRQQ
jgi:hypothetical protein